MSDKETLEKSLEEVIEQASKLHLQRELSLQFERNIKLLDSMSPEMAKRFKNYQPQRFQLGIDDSLCVNLYDIQDGIPVYEEDAEEFCQRQVEAYFEKPLPIDFYLKNYPNNEIMFSSQYINQLLNENNDKLTSFNGDHQQPITLMLVTGIGLGYHLIELIKTKNIYHICLFENEPDFFFACLHTIDWQVIFSHFNQSYRSLKLFLEKDIHHSVNGTKSMVSENGLTVLSNGYFFNHLDGNYYNNFLDTFRQQASYLNMGYGSLEDEVFGIAHTLINLKNNHPVLTEGGKATNKIPCFIVANGPSLDYLIDTIKAYKEKAIIISCGSTLSVLYRSNITPDLHIEIERTYATTESFRDIDKNYLKNIPLIALNNVPPSTYRLFSKSYITFKTNDAGTILIDEIDKSSLVRTIEYSNPTVTNMAIAVSIKLGFTELYLLGVDLGSKTNQHHAKNSVYEDHEKFKDIDFSMPLVVEGNFGSKVKTSSTLLYANYNISACIENNSNINVYNLSNGAKIHLTHPLKIADMAIDEKILDKSLIVSDILEQSFIKQDVKLINNREIIDKHFSKVKEYLTLLSESLQNANPQNSEDVFLIFSQLTLKLKDLENQNEILVWVLCNCVTQMFFSLILRILFSNKDSNFHETYKNCISILSGYFTKAQSLLSEEAFKEQQEVIW